MATETIGLIGLAIMLVCVFTRMWTGLALMLVGFIGCGILGGWSNALSIAGTLGYHKSADYAMSSIPFFIFMGGILFHTAMGADIYRVMRVWLSKIRGGLAMATVVACGIFSAICGDSIATAVTMGKVCYPEMQKYKYSDKLASCCVAAGGTIGIMIPPSIPFIIYGVMTETSIGKLFMAGVIPGLIQIVLYVITIWIWCKIKPDAAPASFSVTMKERVKESKAIIPLLIILVMMLGGLYQGFFTPTEAGAFSAAATMGAAFFLKRLNKKTLSITIIDGLSNSAMVLFMLIGAYFFTRFIMLSGLPQVLSAAMLMLKNDYGVSTVYIVILIVFIYILLGCFLDCLAAVVLTIPFFFPIIVALGLDPIWWGVLMVRVLEIGLISPPYGLNLFVLAKAVKVPLGTMYRGIWPFLVADLVHILLLVFFPALSLWLPSHM